MLFVESYKNKDKIPTGSIIIDTTSRSNSWTRGLSPFIIQAGHLYGNFYAHNVENGWQYTKTYTNMVDENQNPNQKYWDWAQKGWADKRAQRYPMGKDAKPLYSYWDGEKLGYIEARKKIYVPLYSRGVVKQTAFQRLLELYRTETRDIYLIDFDGYNHKELNMKLIDILNEPNRKMGHAFVIYALLQKMK